MMNSGDSSGSHFNLDYDKVQKLGQVLEDPVQIHSSRDDHPSVSLKPVDLVRAIEERILKLGEVYLHDVRLNGSAATWVVHQETPSSSVIGEDRLYNDIDLIFRLDIPDECFFDAILQAALFGFQDVVQAAGFELPSHSGTESPNPYKLQEAYVRKLARVWNNSDHWCLISFHNFKGLDLELKFVSKCQRPFEFSVDSFQVIIDSYVALKKVSPLSSPHLFPTVSVETMWGDYQEALRHVNERWIATRNPESIRGGGLLKYCKLLVLGYRPAYCDLRRMERYMCSRFFIDFATPCTVEIQIRKYLETHFRLVQLDVQSACRASAFLWTLLRVVEVSSECLTMSDRSRIMQVIMGLAHCVEQPFLAIIRPPALRPIPTLMGKNGYNASLARKPVRSLPRGPRGGFERSNPVANHCPVA